MHSSNILRNSFIIEEDEEKAEELVDDAAEDEDITNTNTNSNTNDRISGTTLTTTELSRSRGQSPAKKILSEITTNMGASPTAISGDMLDKAFELPFSELVYINLADNQVGLTSYFWNSFFWCTRSYLFDLTNVLQSKVLNRIRSY